MEKAKDLLTVNDYCKGFGMSTLHPLVSAIDLSEGTWTVQEQVHAVRYHFYAIFLKQGEDCALTYGRKNYDYQDGTLVFIGPGQVVNIEQLGADFQPTGHALLFHPDLLEGTALAHRMPGLSYFSYDLHEALHLSERERQIVLDCFNKIRFELSQGIDHHSKTLIISNVELFLNYCRRFYDRQFITRDTFSSGIIQRFRSSLRDYLVSGKARELGTPTVSYFAEEQHFSSNYFGDLVKRETGKSAHEQIQDEIIGIAKEKIFNPETTLSEIAYAVGFKYPQHFTRFFKKKVGCTPQEYRRMN